VRGHADQAAGASTLQSTREHNVQLSHQVPKWSIDQEGVLEITPMSVKDVIKSEKNR
jgi:hypothetical protein